MNRDGTKSKLRWAIEIIVFLSAMCSIAIAYGVDRGKITSKIDENAKDISRVDNGNVIFHAGLSSDISAIREMYNKEDVKIEKILTKLEYIEKHGCYR